MKHDPIAQLRDAIVNFFTDEWRTIDDKRYHLPTKSDFAYLLCTIEGVRQHSIPLDLANSIQKLEDYLKTHRPIKATLADDSYCGFDFAKLADEVLKGKGTFCGNPFSAREFYEEQMHRAYRNIGGVQVPTDLNIVEEGEQNAAPDAVKPRR